MRYRSFVTTLSIALFLLIVCGATPHKAIATEQVKIRPTITKTVKSHKRVAIDIGDAPSRGPVNAPVMVITFGDYQCPYCARVAQTVAELRHAYGEKIRYVFLDFPLSFHADALLAHEAAYCALDHNKYWEMHDLLFAHQQQLKRPALLRYAQQLGVNLRAFNDCLTQHTHASRVERHREIGLAIPLIGTPTTYVNGEELRGAEPYADFDAAVQRALGQR